ncbi:MAG: HD domain-containing protein [Candidatus Omnitrophica bacterium]|nr:HD domain-containing protein [Candidatus Omnitrophota bacterium]
MPRMVDLIGGSGSAQDGGDDPKDKKTDKDYLSMSKKIISAMKNKDPEAKKDTAVLYERIVRVVSQLLEKTKEKGGAASCMQDAYAVFDELFNKLITGEAILEEIYETREGYYLPYHIANMIVLASFLGIKMGLNKSRLGQLGLAALFCDIGLDRYKDIISKRGKLDQEEFKVIRKHVADSIEILDGIPHISKIVKDAITAHHERTDGSGYPDGLKMNEISDYAKIIGLVDTYDALTNDRPYREGGNAHETIKLLLGSLKGSFDHDTMRSLLNALSLYPIGTLVELDTGEVARVIGAEPGSPLKPIVMIVQDYSGNPVKEKKIINLAVTDSISIVNSK